VQYDLKGEDGAGEETIMWGVYDGQSASVVD
jgi:hypothetical protein